MDGDDVNSFFSEILVRALRSRIEGLATVDKFAVYFCPLPIPFFKEHSFVVDILYKTNCPSIFLCYSRGRVSGVCHVPEVLPICTYKQIGNSFIGAWIIP